MLGILPLFPLAEYLPDLIPTSRSSLSLSTCTIYTLILPSTYLSAKTCRWENPPLDLTANNAML